MTDPTKGAEAPKNATPDKQSLTPVSGLATDKKDPDNDAAAVAAKKKEAADAAIAKEVEAQAEMSAAEQKKLEGILGNESEAQDDDIDAPSVVKTLTDEELDRARIPAAMKKIYKLISTIPAETPDEHVIWGAAGIKLVLGDLRELCKYVS